MIQRLQKLVCNTTKETFQTMEQQPFPLSPNNKHATRNMQN